MNLNNTHTDINTAVESSRMQLRSNLPSPKGEGLGMRCLPKHKLQAMRCFPKPEVPGIRYFLFIIPLFFSFQSNAQGTYPVTANIQLTPPYSVYMSDFVSPASNKLFVSLLFNDLADPMIDVRLRFTIEGVGITIQNGMDFRPPQPIHLQSGTLERLDASLLATYFDPNNLVFQGYTRQQYQRSAALPEGFYKITVQVYEFTTGVLISNKAVYSAWLMLNDPPRVISPNCGDKIRVLNPQNIVFQWAPMHMASPISGEETEYYFKMVQILPAGRNPNDAILSSVPVFEFTTENSSFLYGMDDPMLIPGQQYAWRVQAKFKNGKSMFKNDGYSQVCWFTYGDPCTPPVDISANVQNEQRVNIAWSPLTFADGYTLRYKEKNNSSANWYENQVTTSGGLVSGITSNKTYEYQVQTTCGSYQSDWSKADTFKTIAGANSSQCGVQITIPQASTQDPLMNLLTNDAVTVDGFKVRIIQATGGNGVYTGTGVAYIPFLSAYIKMTFSSIYINKEYIVTQGRMVAVKSNKVALYRGQVQPRVYRDICTGGGDGNSAGNPTLLPTSSTNNNSSTNTSSLNNDTIRVISINGNTEVRTGDTITVNGKQLVVDKNTVIKNGDQVVVNGNTITVSTVSSKIITSSSAAASLNGTLPSAITEVIQAIKADIEIVDNLILNSNKDVESKKNVLKLNEEIPLLEGGEGGVSENSIAVSVNLQGMELMPYFKESQSNVDYKNYSNALDSSRYYLIMKKVKENNGTAILESYLNQPLSDELRNAINLSMQSLSVSQLDELTKNQNMCKAYIRSYIENKIALQIGLDKLVIVE